jgi:hypothetical protein
VPKGGKWKVQYPKALRLLLGSFKDIVYSLSKTGYINNSEQQLLITQLSHLENITKYWIGNT